MIRFLRDGPAEEYREHVLFAMTWLIRAGVFAAAGVGVFLQSSLGPVALPVAVTVYVLCGVLMVGWAVLERRHTAGRRAVPVVLGVITVLSCVVSAQSGIMWMAGLAVVTVIAAAADPRLAVGWTVFAAGATAVTATSLLTRSAGHTALEIMLMLAVGLLAGLNRCSYRVRAEQNAVLLAQAGELRAQRERGAVLDERTRIAREIHDVLAHSLGALSIQIQTARALLAEPLDTATRPDPARADAVLAVAHRLASEGLQETRRAVHALRSGTRPLNEELAAMAEAHRQRHAAAVDLQVDGTPASLPPEQTLALVRTAQESLVNAAKHAPRRPVTLTLTYEDHDVTLQITNPLGGTSHDGFATVDGGYGLTGMRERLLLLGGTLTTGAVEARSPGGAGELWTVTARVPR